MNPRATAIRSALAGFIIVILVASPQAQQIQQFASAPARASGAVGTPADAPTDIDLLVGRSTIVNVGSPIHRVSLTVPDIADALVTAPTQLLIHGKQPGTISLFVWDKAGAIRTYEVKVRRDLSALAAHMKQLFPGEPITVLGSGKDVVLSGKVSGQYVIDKAADVAAGYVEKKEDVVNLLKQQEGVASNQVLLRVRFAEVSRNALQEVGASLFSDGREGRFARTTTQQFSAPVFDLNHPSDALGKTLVFSDYLNLFLFDAKEGLGAVVKALQGKGVFQSLAEPNLVALNGKEASFLAGGEFPIPVVQGTTNAVTIMFKEFGVRLNFTPTVLGGDLVNLKIKPEVSALDFNNAIVLNGFRIPALTSRRAETEIELRDGQTFAIAGLMNNSAVSSMRKVPGLGDIPILGLLFKSRAYQKDQTELVVMVTPHIVRRDSTGVSEGLPTLVEPFLGAPDKRIPPPNPYVGSPRYPANQPERDTNNPAAAAAGAAVPRTAVLQPAEDEPVAQPNTAAPAKPAPGVTTSHVPAPATTPAAAAEPAAAPTPAVTAPPKPTKAELKAAEKAREEERERAEAEAKAKAAEEKRLAKERAAAEKKAEEDRKRAEKLEKERAKREAEVAKKNAEIARKEAEEKAKRDKALADAAERLKAAQAAYQAEIAKAKGGGGQ